MGHQTTGQRRSGRGYLPNLETILNAEKGKIISEQGWDCCLRKKRREQGPVQIQRYTLPQFYQKDLSFRSHDQMGLQGIDKIYQRILKRFEWPVAKKACEKWVTACLSCQQLKDPRKLRFPLQSIGSSEFNEVVQIDHQKIYMTVATIRL